VHVLQYEIRLPTDYDMGIIRHRVATRGSALDEWPGLGLKAYLIGAHSYAPFYLWNDAHGMNRFLWGGGFGNIVRDFGRPPIRQWIGVGFARGPASSPTTATRQDVPLPEGASLDEALEEMAARAQQPDVHSTALAIDPHSWTLTHFTLGGTHPGTRYEVLHLSAPGLDAITPGRHY
jgi:Domain of unknown function (DUF4865)